MFSFLSFSRSGSSWQCYNSAQYSWWSTGRFLAVHWSCSEGLTWWKKPQRNPVRRACKNFAYLYPLKVRNMKKVNLNIHENKPVPACHRSDTQAYLVQEFACSGLEQIDRVNILNEIHVYPAFTIIAKKDLDNDIFVSEGTFTWVDLAEKAITEK